MTWRGALSSSMFCKSMFWKFLLPARLPEPFERPRWPPSSWKDTKIILLLLHHRHHHHDHLVELLIDGERNTWLDVAVDVVLHPRAVYPTDGLQLQSLGSGHLEFLQVRLCVRINVSILLIRIWRSGCEEINTDQSLTEQRLELRRRTDWPLLGQNERHTLFREKKELVLSRAEKEYSGGEKRLGRIQGLGKRRKILESLHQHDQLFFFYRGLEPLDLLCVFFSSIFHHYHHRHRWVPLQ